MSEINTEQVLRDEFESRIKSTTIADLPAFISEVMDREHDYGSICVAIGLVAATAAWACNKHQQGGITGFQAGAIAWEILRHWGALYPGECGGRMTDYDNLLYPQMEHRFTKISADTWKLVQEKAAEKLATAEYAHQAVRDHWLSIVEGTVPFGLQTEEGAL